MATRLRTMILFSLVIPAAVAGLATACGSGADDQVPAPVGCACYTNGYDSCGDDTDTPPDASADAAPDAGPIAVSH